MNRGIIFAFSLMAAVAVYTQDEIKNILKAGCIVSALTIVCSEKLGPQEKFDRLINVVRSQSSDVTAHKSQNCLQNVTAEVETLPFDCEKELNDTIDLLALKDDYEVEKVKVLWGGIATLMLMTESTSPIERAVVILELYFTVLAPEGTPLDEDLSQRLEVILETIYVRDYPSSYERYLLLATEILHFAEQPARIERYNIHNDPLILKTVYVASDFQ